MSPYREPATTEKYLEEKMKDRKMGRVYGISVVLICTCTLFFSWFGHRAGRLEGCRDVVLSMGIGNEACPYPKQTLEMPANGHPICRCKP